MKIQLIRNATLWIEYGGVTFLVDPMLSEQGVNPPIFNTENDRKNPLVPLPGNVQQWLQPDAILVTHLHPDHWDEAAVSLLPHSIPVLCQDGNQDTISAQGFEQVTVIEPSLTFRGVTLTRTSGQHGTGDIGELMGRVSGFIFQAEGEPTLYIAGDTIWCEDVRQALDMYTPDWTIVNAGGARFLTGGHITMDDQDVVDLCAYAPHTSIVAVHMDAINHCLVTREKLQARLEEEGLLNRVAIPQDGEWFGQ
ncbi:MBL fold metallo-hydrolase [Paenibacillus sp. NPDC058177]|uniref:MBL fold metallo-hydrolase n=1 Tax=Paenibacillus sp. NPDC058177 TaxID=3346369 RepID=UPI0036DD17CD